MLRVALRAAKDQCSSIFAILTAHDCLEGLPMDDQLAIAAGRSSLPVVKHLMPYLQKHDSSNAMFKALEALYKGQNLTM